MALKRSFIAVVFLLLACKEDRPPPPPPSVPAETPKPAEPGAPSPAAPAAPAAAAAPDPESDEPTAWVIHSGDGRSTLRQKPAGPGKCLLTCTGPDEQPVWSATAVPARARRGDSSRAGRGVLFVTRVSKPSAVAC